MRTDDGSIIYACLNGEPETFGILVDKYKAGIFAYILAKVKNYQDAQEIAQDVFLCAYQGLHNLKKYESFSFWLFRIASNQCKKWQRNKIRHPQPESIEDIDPKIIDNSSLELHNKEIMSQSVREALDSLPETYREVLMLYYFGDMDSKEIAESLGTSPTAIRMRISRAREQLKEEMLAIMGTAFEQEKLRASFTFRIVEAIKRIKISPISPTKGLPWGLSLATGLIAVAFSINSHLIQFDWMSANSFLSSSKAKVLEIGEFPVNILDISQIPNISKGMSEGEGSEQPDMQNALLAPQAEGGTWTKKADMPTARWCYTTELKGKIYAIGGTPDDLNPLSVVEEYDPKTDKWLRKADMPTARDFLSINAVSGKIYAIGGTTKQANNNLLSTVEEYDPSTDKWVKKSDMPTKRCGLSTCVVNGTIYAIGGWGPDYLSTVEEYNPIIDKWAKKADMPTARNGFSTCVVNEKIYAIGGFRDSKGTAFVEEYDPKLDKWTKKSDMPTPKGALCAAVINGKIYVIGGTFDLNQVYSTVEEYDPVSDTWAKKADMQMARAYVSASVYDGKIYAIGGASGAGYLSSVEEYTPEGWQSISQQGKLPDTWGKIKAE